MLISAAKYKTSFATLLWKKDPRIYLEKKQKIKRQCLFCRQDGSSKRLCRKEVNSIYNKKINLQPNPNLK